MSPAFRDLRGNDLGEDGLSDRERERAAAKTRRTLAAIARATGAPPSDTGISRDDLDLAEDGATGQFTQAVERPIPAIDPADLAAVAEAPRRPTTIPAGPAMITPASTIPRATDLILLEIAAGASRQVQLAAELRVAVQRDTDQHEKVRQFLAMAADLRGPVAAPVFVTGTSITPAPEDTPS